MNLPGGLLGKVLFRIQMQRGVRSFLRKNYWRARGLRIGSGAIVSKFTAKHPRQVSIGKHCHLEDGIDFKFASLTKTDAPSIIIGQSVFLGKGCEFNITSTVRIADDCLIASGCKIIDHDHGMDRDSLISSQAEIEAPISIEADAWLGVNVVVLKGVTIGRGAVIAAGAVVTKSVPSYEIWGGVPARKISSRTAAKPISSESTRLEPTPQE